MYAPSDIANEALDAIGVDYTIGDIEEGNRFAQVCLRKYRPCVASLLKAAHWSFARQQAQMQILADRTGQYATNTNVILPWLFEYALPNDCVHARHVPWQMQPVTSGAPAGNYTSGNPNAPLMSGMAQMPVGYMRPARFMLARDPNFTAAPGAAYWDVQGVSPLGQTVVLTNVPQAYLIYTALVLTPSEWDTMFREAMVAYLASEIALPLTKDKKAGLAIRAQQIAIAKDKISEARAQSANENWNQVDLTPDWIRARSVGRGYGMGWSDSYGLEAGGLGTYGSGWADISLGGAAF